MDYKTNIEFLDWLMWDKEINEKEWLETSEKAKEALFKEFKKTRKIFIKEDYMNRSYEKYWASVSGGER